MLTQSLVKYQKPKENPQTSTKILVHENEKNSRQHCKENPPITPINDEQIVKINGINSNSDIIKVKRWLEMYGELQDDIAFNIVEWMSSF